MAAPRATTATAAMTRAGSTAATTPMVQIQTTRTVTTAEPGVVSEALRQAGLAPSFPWTWLLLAAGAYYLYRNRSSIQLPSIQLPQAGTPTSFQNAAQQAARAAIPSPPPATPVYLGTPTNLRVLGATAHSVIVATDPVVGALYYEWHDLANGELLARSPTPVAVIQGLQENTTYDVYVVAVGAQGARSQPSQPLLIRTTQGRPEGIVTEVNVPSVSVTLNVNLPQFIGPVNVPVAPAPQGAQPNAQPPQGVSPIPVQAEGKYSRPTSQVVNTPVGPAYALAPTAYSLSLPTHYTADQVAQLSNGAVHAPAVMPIPLGPELDPSSSRFNPQAIVETAVEQQNPVPPGYPFASFAQAQEAVNWWVRTHPNQPLPPDLNTVAQAWFAAGMPSG
jgi:hypothetical protein